METGNVSDRSNNISVSIGLQNVMDRNGTDQKAIRYNGSDTMETCFHYIGSLFWIAFWSLFDVFPLAFRSGSIAIRYASYHFQNRSVPTPLRYENHAEKNMFQWKQKAYPIWKLERSHSDPVWWKHSIKSDKVLARNQLTLLFVRIN